MSGFIRSNIDELDQHVKDLLIAAGDPEDLEGSGSTPPCPIKNFDTKEYDQHRALGSPSKPCTIQALEDAHKGDDAFKNLRRDLGKLMTWFLPEYEIPLPDGKDFVRFRPTDMVRHC